MAGATVGKLFKAKAILEEDVAAAVDAFVADANTRTGRNPYWLGYEAFNQGKTREDCPVSDEVVSRKAVWLEGWEAGEFVERRTEERRACVAAKASR